MSQVSTRRCPACHEIVLVADRGRVRMVGETRYVELRPSGDAVYRCVCGATVVWEREKVGT